MYAYGERWVGRRAEVRLPSAVRMEKGGYLGDGFSRFVLFVSQMYPVYETIGAADRYYMVSHAASSSIVVASRQSSFSSHQPREFLPLVRRGFFYFI
jgi:hypothetical protein